ncbi:hypothetical protein [Streptomyces sp. NRRL S-244]|uniref:hypothetical protein n=1 Tax=Streptomyces sp. NRRL S-244 TaxID=1463897 RepID=UPI0009963B90|nr:hypothetical protein [Streptomyces sp. NRRL S-244]
MFETQLALVCESENVTSSEFSRVVAALQTQAIRDFRPVWNITATVDAFQQLEDVPVGSWPIIIQDVLEEKYRGCAGVHADKQGQPFALVLYDDGWSHTASHEMLEMLADPWGNRLTPGRSPRKNQGVVEFLVEISDPSGDAQFGYEINGILVSDFYTPNFHDPLPSGIRYSFGGKIAEPRQILPGGYISWHDPISEHWWQQRWFDTPKSTFHDLGVLSDRTGSLRAAIDARTGNEQRSARTVSQSSTYTATAALTASFKVAGDSRARGWRAQIADLEDGSYADATWLGDVQQGDPE